MSDDQPWSWARLRGALERTVKDLREGAAQLLESWTETPAQFGERMRAAYAAVYLVDGEWAHEQAVRDEPERPERPGRRKIPDPPTYL